MDSVKIEYIADSDVGSALDMELRRLLSACFTGPEDEVFKRRRFFHEPPARRWLARDSGRGILIAHLALHERALTCEGRTHAVGGVAEVCVHADYRNRGLLKVLVGRAHEWMRERGYAFAVLFGDPAFYASSGYFPVENLWIDAPGASGALEPTLAKGAMAAALAEEEWPRGQGARMPGLAF